jgi:predicted O-methyltransferase YrrM
MSRLERIVAGLKSLGFVYPLLILPFYFVRFVFHAFRQRSLWYLRYYPGHYGSTIPSGIELQRAKETLFSSSGLPNDGVSLNLEGQHALLHEFKTYYPDFRPNRFAAKGSRYYYDNALFGFNDAFILYAFLRKFQPARVIEVGSGFSSALMLDIADEILSKTHFTFIDPYSTTIDRLLESHTSARHRVVRERVQDVGLDLVSSLAENDILFIDSSHVVKIGSDLSRILFEILPALNAGTLVHIHDVYWTFEYPAEMIAEGRIWNEAYFVRAFLQYNSAFEVLYFSSLAESRYRPEIESSMPGYFRDTGKSLWLRKIL